MNKVILALATICCVVNSVSFASEEDSARKFIEKQRQELRGLLVELKQELRKDVSVRNVDGVVGRVSVVCDQYEMLDCRCKELGQTWRIRWEDIGAGRKTEWWTLMYKMLKTCDKKRSNATQRTGDRDTWSMYQTGVRVAMRLFNEVFGDK